MCGAHKWDATLNLNFVIFSLSNFSHRMSTTTKRLPPISRPQTKVGYDLLFLVKLSTPYISAVKKINAKLKLIDRKRRTNYQLVKYFTVKGMGKAMAKVALLLQEFPTRKVDVLTGTVEVIDQVSQPGEDDTYNKRRVSYIELRISI